MGFLISETFLELCGFHPKFIENETSEKFRNVFFTFLTVSFGFYSNFDSL